MNRAGIFIIIILILTSCEDSVKFEVPQPVNQQDLSSIPQRLRGTYLSTSDSSFLTINEQAIINWIDIEFQTLKDSLEIEIDSTKITNRSEDHIEIFKGESNLKLKLKGDSILIHYSLRDTIFNISEHNLLRKFKGHYFLNFRRSENNWKVRRLTLDKKRLFFSKVRIPENISTLQQITAIKEVRSDSGNIAGYKLNPSKRELKKLMKHGFSETAEYKKLNQ